MSSKATLFRVTGLPASASQSETSDVESQLRQFILSNSNPNEKQKPEPKIQIVPSCYDTDTQTALVEFPSGPPSFLSKLDRDPLCVWQAEMGTNDISFDVHFFGLTQLYGTARGKPITAE